MYLMRVIKNFGTRELILMGVELSWIFFIKSLLLQIYWFGVSEVSFWDKKQKDLRHDGNPIEPRLKNHVEIKPL